MARLSERRGPSLGTGSRRRGAGPARPVGVEGYVRHAGEGQNLRGVPLGSRPSRDASPTARSGSPAREGRIRPLYPHEGSPRAVAGDRAPEPGNARPPGDVVGPGGAARVFSRQPVRRCGAHRRRYGGPHRTPEGAQGPSRGASAAGSGPTCEPARQRRVSSYPVPDAIGSLSCAHPGDAAATGSVGGVGHEGPHGPGRHARPREPRTTSVSADDTGQT
jgi:hypothetical protein